MIQISDRMQAVASLVEVCGTLADVGCDHGYVPIYLLQSGKIKNAIAMDVNQGPLDRARAHIEQNELEEYIELRLSDGVKGLELGEADTVIIAGMGGALVKRIVLEGAEILEKVSELILQPQSEIENVRRYLRESGYAIVKEDMVLEDGKYYPMMRVVHAGNIDPVAGARVLAESGLSEDQILGIAGSEENLWDVLDLYGEKLIEARHPILKSFLQKEEVQLNNIERQLMNQSETEKILSRRQKLKKELELNRIALRLMEI